MFDTIVIGKGLIGSATTRYLSQHSSNIAVIGPDEPDDWTAHRGVFASHYDQGRITRILDEDPVWALLAKRSIEQYHYIEANSGISFHYPNGGLQTAADADYIDRLARVGQQFEANFQTYRGSTALAAVCPQFSLPEGTVGVLEGGGAGYINPRALAAAQLTIARQQGASIIRERVVSVETHQAGVIVTTAEAHTYQANRAVIAAGAYTNMLVDPPLALTLKPRTILLAELSPPAAARLAAMPTLIYDFRDNSAFDSIYMAPPLEYPDGKTYIKIGGDRLDVPVAHSFDALRAWFNSGGSRAEAEALKTVLLDLIPDLGATVFLHKPCVTTSTPHHHPFIDTLKDGRLFVAAGGCGMAAKSSNEIGRLAAVLARHNAWEDEAFAADDFKIRPF